MGTMCNPAHDRDDAQINFRVNFTTPMQFYFDRYTLIVNHLRQTNLFATQSEILTTSVDIYLKDLQGFDHQDKNLLSIEAANKLHPLVYGSAKVDNQWLISACLRQHKFISDFPTQLLHFSDCYRHYVQFLFVCSRRPTEITVPNKLADFMWHSHMLDHQNYKKDMIVVLGKVLDHRDDYSYDELKEFEGETIKYKQKVLPVKKKQGVKGQNVGYSGQHYQGYRNICYGQGVCGGHHQHSHHKNHEEESKEKQDHRHKDHREENNHHYGGGCGGYGVPVAYHHIEHHNQHGHHGHHESDGNTGFNHDYGHNDNGGGGHSGCGGNDGGVGVAGVIDAVY